MIRCLRANPIAPCRLNVERSYEPISLALPSIHSYDLHGGRKCRCCTEHSPACYESQSRAARYKAHSLSLSIYSDLWEKCGLAASTQKPVSFDKSHRV